MLEPSFAQKKELADLLLACSCLKTTPGYLSVRNELSARIQQTLSTEIGSTSSQLIINLITNCLKHPGGLYELYTIIEHFEGGSKQFTELENFIFGQYIAEFNKQFPGIVNYPLLPLVPGALTNSADSPPASDFGDDLLDLIYGSYELDVRANPKNPADFTPKLIEGEKRVELEQYLNEKKKLVLVGLPGAGKTTALRRLGLLLAKNWRTPENLPKELAGRIPIYVPLNLWSNPQQTLKDYIADRLTTGDSHFWAFAVLLDGLLESNRLLLLLDGLNEIPQLGRDEKSKFIKDERFDQIVQLATSHYTGLACLLSCRQDDFVVNDKEVKGWAYLNMQPLGETEIRDFANWFAASRQLGSDFVEFLIADLFDIENISADDFEHKKKWQYVVRQPFYLKPLLYYCHHNKLRKLPESLKELLKYDIDRRLWFAKKGRKIDENDPIDQMLNKLKILAFNMTEADQLVAEPFQQAVTWLSRLRNVSQNNLYTNNGLNVEPLQPPEAKKLLNLASNSNIANDTSTGGVSFAHQLLQEYFTADCLQEFFFHIKLPYPSVLHDTRFNQVRVIWQEMSDEIQQTIEVLERPVSENNKDEKCSAISELIKDDEPFFRLVEDENLVEVVKNSLLSILMRSEEHTKISRVIKALTSALQDPSTEVYELALTALKECVSREETKAAIEPILTKLQDEKREVRVKAIELLEKYAIYSDTVEVIEHLIPLLSDASEEVRETTVRALNEYVSHPESQIVIEPLATMLNDSIEQIRSIAVSTIGKFSSYDAPFVIDQIIRALQDSYWEVRKNAIKVLEEQGINTQTIKAIKPLIILLEDPDPDVIIAAQAFLDKYGEKIRLVAENCLSENEVNVETLLFVCEKSYEQKHYDITEKVSRKLVENFPKNESAYWWLTYSILAQGSSRKHEAQQAFKNILELNSADNYARWLEWWTGVDEKLPDANYWQTLNFMEADDHSDEIYQGVAQLLQGKFVEAIIILKIKEESEPENYETVFWLGMAHAYNNDLPAATSAWQQAIDLDLPCGLLHPIGWLRDKLAPEDWEKARAFWATYDPDAPKE
jgi:HEAT repeat protein